MMVAMRFVVGCLVFLLVHFFGALAVGNTTAKCREKERLSLVSLKHGFVMAFNPFRKPPYGSLSTWASGENQTDCCTWDGVSCDTQTGHVVGLYLCNYEVEGTIPPLAQLHHLKDLELARNNFTPAQFPTSILSLKRLQHLDLATANLKGNIPVQLGYSLSQLQTLCLNENQLEGGIPKSLALCSLIRLNLSNNSLSGQLDDFVAAFRHCANISLQILDLSYNQFTGSVPDFSQLSFLETLLLNNNQLNGTLNDVIGLLSKLKDLDINANFLKGVISETHFLRHSQLEALDLSFNDLTFKISPDWIPPFQLTYILLASCKLGPGFPMWLRTQKSGSHLDISNAEISDAIPSWFWDLRFDQMNLSHNQITGELQNFHFLSSFGIVDFSSNLFEGSIPSVLPHEAELMVLDLSNNKFIDASTFLCPNKTMELHILDLSNNQLHGVLPDCWKYFKKLVFLDVANNSFFGKIPTSMGSLRYIRSLHLGFNKFSGEIPLSLNKCMELVAFDAAQNNLSGLIPSWIGDRFIGLRFFILRSSKFFGGFPSSICNLTQLRIIDLSMNNISGSLPRCLNQLSTLTNQPHSFAYDLNAHFLVPDMFGLSSKDDTVLLVWKGKVSKYRSILGLVKSIDLSYNMLMGEIPSELMDLVGLCSLNISRNMLSGQIPTTIGQLKSLDFLDMSRNHLFGHIPSELSQIDRLSVMDLSYNNLFGEIPHGTQLQSFDPSAYEGNAHLCGAPLPKCPTRPTQDNPNDENPEEDYQFFSRGFFISMSIGFCTGFLGICSLIFLNQSFRYAYFRLLSDIYGKVYVIVAINVAKLRRWKRSVST